MAIRDQIMLLVVVLFGMASIFTLHFYSSDLETKRQIQDQKDSLQQQIDQLRNEQLYQAEQIAELANASGVELKKPIPSNSTSKIDSLPTLYSSFDDDQEVSISRPIHIYTHGGTTWLVEGWPVPNCPVECYFKRTAPVGNDADAVFYSGFDAASGRGETKYLKIFFASESDALYEFHRNQYSAGFDITVSYHLDNDEIIMKEKRAGRKWIHLPISYAPYEVDKFYDPVQPKQKDLLASIFMSNCGNSNSGRNDILQELIDTIGVASFGKCMHNKEPEDLGCHLQHYEQKLCAISKYKFYLAFENSIDPSYVTEKYWQALKAGTVPVYLGAPNVEEFDPMYGLGGKSVIKISDFESTTELAKYLQYLDKNETAYNEYLKWKGASMGLCQKICPKSSYRREISSSFISQPTRGTKWQVSVVGIHPLSDLQMTDNKIPHIPKTQSLSRKEREALVQNVLTLRGGVGSVPSSFQFSRDGSKLYFIGCQEKDTKSSLHHVDLTANDGEWKPVIGAQHLEQKTGGVLTKEEELLRERKRIVLQGITSYTYHKGTQQILVPSSGSIFRVQMDNNQVKSVEDLPSSKPETRMDPKFSSDGRFVSFVRKNNLFAIDLQTGKELQLTYEGSDAVSCGVAEYIIQEEFDRFTGYWWAPAVVTQQGKTIYRILYFQVDESMVGEYPINEYDLTGSLETGRYPLVGGTNAECDVYIAEIVVSDENIHITQKGMYPKIKTRFPSTEYVVRGGWFPDAENVWIQVLDRMQENLHLVEFNMNQFAEFPGNEEARHTILFHDTSKYWINVTDLIHIFKDGSLLWASEVSGYRHLYYVDPRTNTVRMVTQGEWQVDTSSFGVDETNHLVYFMGTKDTPLEAHLYVTSYQEGSASNTVKRLTEPGFYHQVTLDILNGLFVSVHSNSTTKPAVAVFKIVQSSSVNTITTQKLFNIAVKYPHVESAFSLVHPEIFSFQNSQGHTLYGAMYKPSDYDPNKKYPTILQVYGGPHVQLVSNNYDAVMNRFLKFQMYTHLGYVVVMIDGAGSWRRGLPFEGQLKHKMGTVEIRDQVEGLEYLDKLGVIDPKRVCITGWSYGGYLTLMALGQRPDVFKLGIAGAPVVEWEAYDTGYTERYMGTPDNNKEGYRTGSVLPYVPNFPERYADAIIQLTLPSENRLLIVHGLKDENVHFQNTTSLISSLIEANKPYQLHVYPKERHGIRSPLAFIHLELKILSFLQNMDQ